MFSMDIFSHLLWTHVYSRNKLWHEEALFFALLPDVGFLLIVGFVLLGTPYNVNFDQAMLSMPPPFMIVYRFLHSFAAVGIVALFVWKLKPKLLPALSAWVLHICMDIPFHSGAVFGTRFLYPILPNFYISGISWGNYRVLAASYFMLLVIWYYLEMRELSKHRNPSRKADWIDRMEHLAKGLINQQAIPSFHAQSRDYARASEQVSGEDIEGPEEGQDSCTGTITSQEAG